MKTLKQAIIHTLELPGVFVETCRALTLAVREQTRTIEALHTSIKAVESHAKYLATSEQHRLRREGKTHVFTD